MDEVPDTALDLARLVDELTVLDQRRVDIGESLVHLEYLYSQMGARQQADAARKVSGAAGRGRLSYSFLFALVSQPALIVASALPEALWGV